MSSKNSKGYTALQNSTTGRYGGGKDLDLRPREKVMKGTTRKKHTCVVDFVRRMMMMSFKMTQKEKKRIPFWLGRKDGWDESPSVRVQMPVLYCMCASVCSSGQNDYEDDDLCTSCTQMS